MIRTNAENTPNNKEMLFDFSKHLLNSRTRLSTLYSNEYVENVSDFLYPKIHNLLDKDPNLTIQDLIAPSVLDIYNKKSISLVLIQQILSKILNPSNPAYGVTPALVMLAQIHNVNQENVCRILALYVGTNTNYWTNRMFRHDWIIIANLLGFPAKTLSLEKRIKLSKKVKKDGILSLYI